MNLLRAESILIERNNLTLEQVLGQGHFGCVYKGIMHSPDKDLDREVALKTLQSCELSLLPDIGNDKNFQRGYFRPGGYLGFSARGRYIPPEKNRKFGF